MQDFSTQRLVALPRAANLATLFVLVAATWWSGAQRPVEQAANAPAAAMQGATAALPLPRAADLSEVESTSNWPSQSNAVTRDGLQTVGFQARDSR